ncbi:MAG: class IV adenylate cyclase [Candidatus Aenigmarchaeota archaeon]|nr:class IV adenylate cyclase [Candidatus Aenigmarchaeota archaeon]
MAHNDIEIEIKIPLDETNFFRVKEKLKETAKFVKKTQQTDDYFTPLHRNFVEPEFPFEWLSIRKRGDKTILNYKHWHPENVEISTHCDEFETEIKNQDKLEKIFSAIDIKKLITVEKEREVYIYEDKFEIALDAVKELGYFIEVETIKDFGNVEVAREKLFEFAKNLGIDISKTDKRGYPYLLMEKKGLIKTNDKPK